MKLSNFKILLPSLFLGLVMGSCVGDLDVDPEIDPNTITTYNDDYSFNKVFANLGLTGRQGPAGQPDLVGKDEGSSGFFRVIWNANELPTDEAICGWADGGIATMVTGQWDASNDFINLLYYRLMYGVSVTNNYLDQTVDATNSETLTRRAEVRFLRALHFYYLLDAFGNVPCPTTISTDLPEQKTSKEIYDFIEKELTECATDMKAPRTNTYGRPDQVAAWMLLARLYLNAETYTGTPQWAKAAEYAKKVMDSGYSLAPNYAELFMGDNNSNAAKDEVIFPILQDGIQTTSYSGSTFVVASTYLDDMPQHGTTESWAGNRCRPNLIFNFFGSDAETKTAEIDDVNQMILLAKDDRARFFSKDRKLANEKVGTFKDGYSCMKWTGLYSTGSGGNDSKFVDTDIPLMRLAEAYLTFAEATFRANNEQSTAAVANALNALRTRAHAATKQAYTKQDILDEWQKEFYFEGRRRTDLIRFNKFGGYNNDYVWPWKGGTKEGTNFASYRNIYPIPAEDLNANDKITQNPGY